MIVFAECCCLRSGRKKMLCNYSSSLYNCQQNWKQRNWRIISDKQTSSSLYFYNSQDDWDKHMLSDMYIFSTASTLIAKKMFSYLKWQMEDILVSALEDQTTKGFCSQLNILYRYSKEEKESVIGAEITISTWRASSDQSAEQPQATTQFEQKMQPNCFATGKSYSLIFGVWFHLAALETQISSLKSHRAHWSDTKVS